MAFFFTNLLSDFQLSSVATYCENRIWVLIDAVLSHLRNNIITNAEPKVCFCFV